MPSVYGYIRVSTVEQGDAGNGLDAQRDAIQRHFDYKLGPAGFVWGGFFEDKGVSGRTPLAQRKSGARLLSTCSSGDVVVVSKLDRGFRNAADLIMTLDRLEKIGVGLVLLDLNMDSTTPVGRMVIGILGQVAQFDRERIGERTREVFALRKAQGRPCGHPPYGFKLAGPKGRRYFVPDESLRAQGALIVDWKKQGSSFEEIYRRLKTLHAKNGRGRDWSFIGVRRAYYAEMRLQAREGEPFSR